MKHLNCLSHWPTLAQFRGLRLSFSFAIALAMLSGSGQALGDDSGSDWEWRATIYAWFPTIDGNSQLPTGPGGPSIEVDPDDLLSNLDFTFMGALKVKKDSWGLFTDILYLDLGSSKTGSRDFTIGQMELPAAVNLDAVYDLKSWAWTMAGTYSLSESSGSSADLLFGVRLLDLDQQLNWTVNGDLAGLGLPGRSGSASGSESNWDAVIGINGHASLGTDGPWFIPYHADIGAGDSDFTWQAMAGIGYQFGWGAVVLNYRYLDYDLDSESSITDLTLGGFLLGASFAW
jgi:hypothetical protein